ncbi:MAG: hypothetical protein HKO81_00370 [Flavobacteriaceae bacterium]|nr:hypothetical protein [Flavobacteriaceae bacterium]
MAILISSLPDGIQILENSKSELVLEYIEYMILYFGLSLAMIMMMLIPVVLFFSMVGNYISMSDYYKKLNRGINFLENNKKSKYLESLRDKYVKSYSNFFKYFSAIAIWNIFSLLYIIVGFDSFIAGLKEYFYFPFYVFQTLNKEEIFDTIYVFNSEGLIMSAIIILTFSFYHIGKYVGLYIAKNKIKERNLNLVIS